MHLPKQKIIIFLILTAIVLSAGLLYLSHLKESPPGFYIDEALPGYSAYSILKTGKDEYGYTLPLVFRFYGSYNPPIFTYLCVLAIQLWGLSVVTIRVVSALAGVLCVPVMYLLLKELKITKSIYVILSGTLLFAITPWLVFYSRIGYEVVVAFLLLLLGVFFSVKSIKSPKWLFLSFIFLSLSTYAAYAERFVAPLYILGFIILLRKKLKLKIILLSLALAALTQLPNIYLLTTPAFFPKSNLFAQNLAPQAEKIMHIVPFPLRLVLSFTREFSSQYMEYFSPRSLFFVPDPDRQRSFPDISVFFSWMFVLFIPGLYKLWKKRKKIKSKIIILLLVISPLPAALTHDPFSTHRALPLLLPFSLIMTLGMAAIYSKYRKAVIFAFPLIIIFSLLLLWRCVFVTLPNERAKYWMSGLENLSQIIKNNPHETFIIDQTRIKPVYANLAFFLHYNPAIFQKEIDPTIKENYYYRTDFDPHLKFANIDPRPVNWEEDPLKSGILVGDEYTISESQAKEHHLTKVFEITDPQGNVIFKGYETNP